MLSQKKLFPKIVLELPENNLCQRVFLNSKGYCPQKAVVVRPGAAAGEIGGAGLHNL